MSAVLRSESLWELQAWTRAKGVTKGLLGTVCFYLLVAIVKDFWALD
jgi:hypothetical protein